MNRQERTIDFAYPPVVQMEKILHRIESAPVQLPKGWRLSFSMDIAAANRVCPLDFDRLLSFPDLDFFHDVFGINRHINRETGEIMDCFVPRCAK